MNSSLQWLPPLHGNECSKALTPLSRQDYELFALEAGIISKRSELWTSPQFVTDVQTHWFESGNTGCEFSRSMRRSVSVPWRAVVLDDLQPELIDSAIEQAISDPQCELLSLMFPRLYTYVDFVRFLQALIRTERLKLAETFNFGGKVGLGYRVTLHDMDKTIESWVLGFGPAEFLPPTRRAPIIELVIRPKHRVDRLQLKSFKENVAHVAQVSLDLSESEAAALWDATEKNTAQILRRDGHDLAKAKITFGVPREIARLLNVSSWPKLK